MWFKDTTPSPPITYNSEQLVRLQVSGSGTTWNVNIYLGNSTIAVVYGPTVTTQAAAQSNLDALVASFNAE